MRATAILAIALALGVALAASPALGSAQAHACEPEDLRCHEQHATCLVPDPERPTKLPTCRL